MPPSRVAVIGAMPIEFGPLLGKLKPQRRNGVELFELTNAVVAIGGIGGRFARRAAEVAIEHAQPKLLLSAGLAGALSPKLAVGDVGTIREVVDVSTGARYSSDIGGDWVLATSQDVSDAAEKRGYLVKYGADVVDMEAAAVAQVAAERGLEFGSIKAISDDAAFAMPPLNRFIDSNGRFATRKFLLYVALRPRWWSTVGQIRSNSMIATANLCHELEHLIEQYGRAEIPAD